MPKEKKKNEADVWMIDPAEATDLKKGLKIGSRGLICPKCNKSINGDCHACEEVSRLYNTGDKGDRKIASEKKAKLNFFLSVVLKENPNKSFILEIGRNAGNDIINGMEKKGWVDIANPRAGAGREMQITKEKDGEYNKYPVAPCLEKADWDIPDKVIANLPNLDNIIDMIENDELTDDNYMNINTIKMDETLTFRICPPAPEAEVFRRVAFVWRHWGVSMEEIRR